MNIKDKSRDLMNMLEAESNRTNKELLIAAAVCTCAGIVAGFFIGKAVSNKNTIKKYNKCYSYDFGDEEE